MSKQNPMSSAMKAASGQSGVPIASLTSNLDLAAMLSKMVPDRAAKSRMLNTKRNGPDQTILHDLTNKTATKIADARSFLQLLPDIKMGMDILVSSVLSPKDMLEIAVTYASESTLVPTNVLANLNAVVDEYFNKDYKITPRLSEILFDILALKGSHPIAVLPENAIDDVINGRHNYSQESFKEIIKQDTFSPIGLLGKGNLVKEVKRPSFALEAYLGNEQLTEDDCEVIGKDGKPLYLLVNDNPNVLRRQELHETLIRTKQRQTTGYGKALESVTEVDNFKDIFVSGHRIYKEENHQVQPMVIVKTQDQLERYSAGKPLIKHFPSESVIPVFSPGDPSDHLGYFCLLNEQGYPLTVNNSEDYYEQLRSTVASAKDSNSNLVKRMTAQFGYNQDTDIRVDALVSSYSDMIEADLNARLRNGMLGGEVKITNRDALMYMMFTRYLNQNYTQVLYLPKDLMNYLAIEFNDYGIGKSLIEDMRVILGLRVTLMFANTMAAVRNSISRTQVNVKFDEYDADPWNTLETIMGEINRTRAGISGNLPIGSSGPAEVVDWLARAGYEFTYEGHPAMPDVKVDFQEKNSNYSKVDQDLEESLQKRTLLITSVPPEVIDNAFSPDFATTVVKNSLLLSKRVIHIQERFTPVLTTHCRTVMVNDYELMNRMRDVVSNNFDDVLKRIISRSDYETITEETEITEEIKRKIIQAAIADYIACFEVSLPRPNSLELENQFEAYETYKKVMEEMLQHIFDDAFANSDTMGLAGDKINILKSATLSYFMRDYIAKNKVVPELFELVTLDEAGNINLDLYDECSKHVNTLTRAVNRFVKSIKPMKDASDEVLNKLEEGETEHTEDSSDYNENEGGDEYGGEAEFDMNFDEPMEGGNEPTEPTEETTEETTEEAPTEGETNGEV